MLTIVSAGQTGVDRAALDVAIELGIAYRGWCPKGGWAEDRPSPPGVLALYPGLGETPHADPRQRTEWNAPRLSRSLISSSLSMPAMPKTSRQAFSAKGRGPWRSTSAARAKARPPAFMPRRRHS